MTEEHMFEVYKGHIITYTRRHGEGFKYSAQIENHPAEYLSISWNQTFQEVLHDDIDNCDYFKEHEIGDPE